MQTLHVHAKIQYICDIKNHSKRISIYVLPYTVLTGLARSTHHISHGSMQTPRKDVTVHAMTMFKKYSLFSVALTSIPHNWRHHISLNTIYDIIHIILRLIEWTRIFFDEYFLSFVARVWRTSICWLITTAQFRKKDTNLLKDIH